MFLVACSTLERFWSCVRPVKDFCRVFDLRKTLVACSTWERFWSCVRSENVFGRMCELKMILFVCSTWERFWSHVLPEKDIGRVFELRKILVVCSTWECVWSCVRPEKDFGRVFDLIKIFGRVLYLRMIFQIVCSTLQWSFDCVFDLRMIRMILWSYVDRHRKTNSGRAFDLKRFGLVSDLWQILAVCTTCGRFSFMCRPGKNLSRLFSIRKSLVKYMFDLGKSLVVCHTFCCYIFYWAFFPFPTLPWTEGKSKPHPITYLRTWVPGPVALAGANLAFLICFVLSLLLTYVRQAYPYQASYFSLFSFSSTGAHPQVLW